MSQPHSTRLTLRAHLLLWQLAVLAPLLLAALLHHLYLMPRFIHPLQKIADEFTDQIIQVKSLQSALNLSIAPIDDYVINGDQRELEIFSLQRQHVEQEFAVTRAIPFATTEERELAEAAWNEWIQAQKSADDLLRIAHPVRKTGLDEKAKRFEHRVGTASVRLQELYNSLYQQVETARVVAHSTHAEMHLLTVAAFIIAIVLSVLIGSSLIRSILANLESMRARVGRIAAGEREQVVDAAGIHELDQLVDTFNVMTRKLQAHDAMLQELASHDPLTCLENRRVFDLRLAEELQRAARYHHPLSLLMLDIDHFKVINDSYGHLAGDAVLRKLATIITHIVRPVDHVFRYGGEEFTVLAPETDAEGALSLAERIRETVAATAFPVSASTEINLTVSIGVTTGFGETAVMEELLAQADKAMYRAKATGRNRTCRYLPATTSDLSESASARKSIS